MRPRRPRLMSLREFGERYYTPASRPTIARLRRLAAAGDIPAIRQGSRWFVDIEKFEYDDVNDLVQRVI